MQCIIGRGVGGLRKVGGARCSCTKRLPQKYHRNIMFLEHVHLEDMLDSY